MERLRRARPAVEAMEPRQLLTTVALIGAGRAVDQTIVTSGKFAALVTMQEHLSGVARIGALGEFRVSDDLTQLSSITLSNSRGTLTFIESGTSTASEEHLLLAAATGAYSGDQGREEMTIILGHENTSTSQTSESSTTTTTQAVSIHITPATG